MIFKLFNKWKNINLLKYLILIWLIIILKVIKSKYENYINNKSIDNTTFKYINLNFTKDQCKLKGLDYLEKIKNNNIINISLKNQINNNPKISVIIPIYNCQNTIEYSIKSVLFQNFNDIEIILVNDHSSDNSSKIIEEFKNYDQRIKILNNHKNMGTLYSRCLGALNAIGEYIIGLDNDDLFLFEEILETLYLNANINHFDIVEIKSFNIPNYHPRFENITDGDFISHPDNLIIYQPELGIFSIHNNSKVEFNDHYAWGKLIRSKIYKNAVYKLGKKRYSQYNCWTEDMTIVFVLFNTANSFIFLNIFGIFHIFSKTTTTFKLSNNHKLISHIFYLGIIFDFSKKDLITKNYVAQYALTFDMNKIKGLDKDNILFFKYIIKKIINCKYISKEYRLKLIEYRSKIK